MKFPEVRVERDGMAVTRVIWDSGRDSPGSAVDMTGMDVAKVERVVDPNDGAPTVRVTFVARLVEVEET